MRKRNYRKRKRKGSSKIPDYVYEKYGELKTSSEIEEALKEANKILNSYKLWAARDRAWDGKYPQKKFPYPKYPENNNSYIYYELTVSSLEKRLEEIRSTDKKNSKIQQNKAKLAAATGKTRDLADTVKSNLPKDHDCPYCGGSLGEEPHADHIYPVSKGGQSSPKNMVYVCRGCNRDKGTMTLNNFIKKYDLDREEIEARLYALDKEF